MKYNIIRDIDKLNEFLKLLPELQSGETYYIRLLTRSKYVDKIKKDYDLNRCVIYKKNDIINHIKRFECEEGLYDGLNNNEIGIYLSPNPRSQKLIIRDSLIKFSNILNNLDPVKSLYRSYRTNCSRHIYFDMDFDTKDYTILKNISNLINKNCVKVLYTIMGFHLIIKKDEIDLNSYPNWYKNISDYKEFDSLCMTDNNVPIPGCSQFGFIPYLKDL